MTDKEFQDRLLNELKSMGIGQRKWHSEKGIPIAIVLMFAAQLVLAGWYSSSVASDVRGNSKDIVEIKKTNLTGKDAKLLRRSIDQNSKDINETNELVRDNGKALYRLQRTIDQYIGTLNENKR